LEYVGVPIYVRPEKPDWLVPNRAGDQVLQELMANGQPILDPKKQRFLQRLPDDDVREYTGRYSLLKTDRLRELWFHITNNCNVTCTHCLVSSSPGARGELRAARILDIAKQASTLGCTVFALSGGEPFVHKEFVAIVDGLLALEDSRVVVLTNGLLLRKHEEVLDRWPCDRFHLQVSVDGLRRSHEKVRGERSFERLESQLRWLRSKGIPFTLSMCVMEENRSEMPDIVDFAAAVGAANVHYLWYFIRGRGSVFWRRLPGERRPTASRSTISKPARPTCSLPAGPFVTAETAAGSRWHSDPTTSSTPRRLSSALRRWARRWMTISPDHGESLPYWRTSGNRRPRNCVHR
jgi:MoaA/NifB/PqqE/SkfB family radical SAM enzyme